MKGTELDEAIYQRYIVPAKRKRTGLVGLEFELPIVNRENKPVDFSAVHKVTEAFIQQFSFYRISRDDAG